MVASKLRVRFAPIKFHNTPAPNSIDQPEPKQRSRERSRQGCRECRAHRVKCDETYPVCRRCERRGFICRSVPRLTQWQVEVPCMLLALGDIVNKRLMQHWFEKTSQMMAIDPNENSLSFLMTRYFAESPSLLHICQSFSASHESYFPCRGPIIALEERGKALQKFRQDLEISEKSCTEAAFFTTILLACSSYWVEHDVMDFGHAHFVGARTILERLLELRQSASEISQSTQFMVGVYLFWDMATSFLVHSSEQTPLGTPLMADAVQRIGTSYHPMYGYCTEILYLLGIVGRYYRKVLDTGRRDPFLEVELETKLLLWSAPKHSNQPISLLAEAYRKQGLLMISLARAHIPLLDRDLTESEGRSVIVQHARDTLAYLMKVPSTSWSLNFQSIPLIIAGSELTEEEVSLRQWVQERLRVIYSLNRCPVSLWAIELLEDVWALHDSGIMISWLERMLAKGQRLLLG
ncbi:hypothetical protein P175DRAFT_0124054 [Aspergillus ochraceoroseus IBT 24754]|uniref:Zn(2)-C6 fungal-type domain-containing protein n=1 Tax=Aspergillus ochraceoroseus IBT 24754 TaxID=1392256 RepID=A0A2T5LKV3_9EURO|nr:uncharacterized protein P175DRAFT_0124054 [Aspergillus ochraceoroseus IBT 24754]PTU16911.1 hypothetical protein P175DRAFT_0124054 [Aspergillus ochraceoroseus IBT 24754]